ncbi:MAG TPA: hypothetical protein VGO13_07315 [Solirubrobacterales bacterium]|jgi:hypothetical protein|nr:hypothetical protein [Solirubrobacterales bacterium]
MNSKHVTKAIGAAVMALVAIAMVAPMAQADTPAAGYTQFAGCPSIKENPVMSTCIRSVVSSGHFKMGSKDVPIEHPITLSGGADEFLGNFAANSKGGMPPVKQKVPGGIIGLTGLTWLAEFLGIEALTLYAATELAGAPSFSGFNNITLPIKVHLINATLGNSCYVGSVTNPITLHLTTGTTSPPLPAKPITGVPPKFTIDEKEIIHLDNGTYVDNAFSAPSASGCVLTLFGFIPISINGLVNTQSGLPSAAGNNETLQVLSTELVDVRLVYP